METSVCAVQPVQHTQHTVTLVELLVVEVVIVGLGVEARHPPHAHSGVVVLRPQHRRDNPHQHRHQMGPRENQTPHRERDQIRNVVLHRVTVHRRQCDGRSELVVHLVTPRVHPPRVQEVVSVVEEHLVRHDKHPHLPRHVLVTWQTPLNHKPHIERRRVQHDPYQVRKRQHQVETHVPRNPPRLLLINAFVRLNLVPQPLFVCQRPMYAEVVQARHKVARQKQNKHHQPQPHCPFPPPAPDVPALVRQKRIRKQTPVLLVEEAVPHRTEHKGERTGASRHPRSHPEDQGTSMCQHRHALPLQEGEDKRTFGEKDAKKYRN
eukprot:Hpha_TRINITY_DN16661_c1_g1::TRINITY_DN16661_c1_g1_i1::g.180456::m.180456